MARGDFFSRWGLAGGMLGMFGCASHDLDAPETSNGGNAGGVVDRCVAIDCQDGGPLFIEAFPDGTRLSMIEDYTFEACWRDRCWTGQHFKDVYFYPGETTVIVGSEDAYPPDWQGAFFALMEFPIGKFLLTTFWQARSPAFEHADGDAFSYSVRDPSGNQLFGKQGTVRWETVELNPDCPPPLQGVCTRAVVQ